MKFLEIQGTAQISFNGATHAIDENINTFCGTMAPESDRLFNDNWDGPTAEDVTCKKCLRKLKRFI